MKKIILAAIVGTSITLELCMMSAVSKERFGEEKESVAVVNTMTVKEHLSMYWKFFFEKGEKTPLSDLPQQQVDIARLLSGDNKGLKASWLGHSSLLINIEGNLILTDPLFKRKVSPVGPVRFNKKLPLEADDLPQLDAVIVSHDHYDHLNKYSIRRLVDKTAVFIVPLRVGKRLVKWGVPHEKIVELDWWQEHQVNENLMIAATPSRHFSGRGLFDGNQTLWASWVVQTDNQNMFFSGDSGYFPGFAEIGKQYGPFDVAFMECGAYNEAWSNIHMFPEQSIQAFEDLGGTIMQPIHWATFNLALHPWYEPIERVSAAAWSRKVQLSVPVIGQVVDYEAPLTTKQWWLPAMKESRIKRGKIAAVSSDYSSQLNTAANRTSR